MSGHRRLPMLGAIGLVAFLAGCAPHEDKPASSLTEAERDTALARSDLPGAIVVQRALDVNGVAADRAAGVDSVGR